MKTLAVEVLVVGAGPAGLAAAGAAATAGCQIGLVDDNPFAGGQIWRQAAQASVKPEAARWVTRARRPNVHLLTNTDHRRATDGRAACRLCGRANSAVL